MMQFELLHVIFVTLLIPPHHIFASLEDNALSVEEQLNQHIRENGGEIKFDILTPCPTCVRGAYASQDFEAGDIIARVPFNLSVQFNHHDYAAGHAHELITKMYTEKNFNETYSLWVQTQPTTQALSTPELWARSEIEMLQSQFMETYAVVMQDLAREHFFGKYKDSNGKASFAPLNDVIKPFNISFETYLSTTALVLTRDFEFEYRGKIVDFMMPSIDMFNDCFEHLCNADRHNDDDFVTIVALRRIEKGEELRMAYQPEVTHRPDMSLLVYGFAMESDPPLLAAIDLPGFNATVAFAPTAPDDFMSLPVGEGRVLAEIDRCKKILDGLSTSLEEDEALVQSGRYCKDWKTNEILKYRIARKRALHYRIHQLLESRSEL